MPRFNARHFNAKARRNRVCKHSRSNPIQVYAGCARRFRRGALLRRLRRVPKFERDTGDTGDARAQFGLGTGDLLTPNSAQRKNVDSDALDRSSMRSRRSASGSFAVRVSVDRVSSSLKRDHVEALIWRSRSGVARFSMVSSSAALFVIQFVNQERRVRPCGHALSGLPFAKIAELAFVQRSHKSAS